MELPDRTKAARRRRVGDNGSQARVIERLESPIVADAVPHQ